MTSFSTALSHTTYDPAIDSWLALRTRNVLGRLDPVMRRIVEHNTPFFRAPLQPSELYDIVLHEHELYVGEWGAKALGSMLGIEDLPSHLRSTIPDIEKQRDIDHECRAFAEHLLSSVWPRELNTGEQAEIASLTDLAGDSHSTLQWIREELVA